MRAPLAVLNEVSLPPYVESFTDAEASRQLGSLVDVLQAINRIRSDVALLTEVPLSSLPVGKQGLPFSAIAEMIGGIARDRWRYVQSRRNIAPYAAASASPATGLDVTFSIGGTECTGLGVALVAEQVALSLPTADRWMREQVEIERKQLMENESGELIIEEAIERVRHVSSALHVQTHAQFIRNLALPVAFSGEDLWEDREARYPMLEFLPIVQGQLSTLGRGTPGLMQVDIRLLELSEVCAHWEPSSGALPRWRSLVTPEHEGRKRFCMFEDVDGVARCFDLHARFTPGAGRIHFRMVPEAKKIRIGYVGLKLGR